MKIALLGTGFGQAHAAVYAQGLAAPLGRPDAQSPTVVSQPATTQGPLPRPYIKGPPDKPFMPGETVWALIR
jgi:hypothetical protein